MHIKYSIGFLIASLIQAGIVMLAENMGISQMGAKLSALQLITHILAGQVAGYILIFIIRKIEGVQKLNTAVIGLIWGTIVWAIVIPINAAQGKVILPWEAGIGTIISSLSAFIIFGIISTFTIKHYGYENRAAREF